MHDTLLYRLQSVLQKVHDGKMICNLNAVNKRDVRFGCFYNISYTLQPWKICINDRIIIIHAIANVLIMIIIQTKLIFQKMEIMEKKWK